MTTIRVLVKCCVASIVITTPAIGSGHQYITDDAAITEFRACQLQVWYGERSSSALPVCTPIRNLEMSLGLIAVWHDEGNGHPEYVAQIKTLLPHLRGQNWGLGFVLGRGRDPGLSGVRKSGSQVYAYVPLTITLLNRRVVFHENTGWLYDRRAGPNHNALTLAARTDVGIRKYLFLIAEAYGAAGQNAEFQAGLRGWTRPGKVQVDLSYGGYLGTGRRAAGWTLGLALTTPPIL